MNPNDPKSRNVNVPPRDQPLTPADRSRQTAQSLMRDQIDRIYADPSDDQTKSQQSNVYQQTHNDNTSHQAVSHDDQWKQYHTAWQTYYQQYYERYYVSQLHKNQQRPLHQAHNKPAQNEVAPSSSVPQTVDKDQAIRDIRGEILAKVKQQGSRAKQSRHFMPIVSAIVVAMLVGTLQYNRLIVANVKAYVSPGEINPQNIVLDPNSSVNVGPEPKLIIPKINVEAPIVYDVGSLQDAPVQKALEDGVVHYPIPGADSLPGQVGNNVILGHSSNDVFDNGQYKFVFVQLDKLNAGDTIYINHEGKRFTYRVTDKFIINPDQVGSLIIDTDKPLLSLVTCTPPGTALRRLVVTAEQVNPNPADAEPSSSQSGSSPDVALPGNSDTIFERLFQN